MDPTLKMLRQQQKRLATVGNAGRPDGGIASTGLPGRSVGLDRRWVIIGHSAGYLLAIIAGFLIGSKNVREGELTFLDTLGSSLALAVTDALKLIPAMLIIGGLYWILSRERVRMFVAPAFRAVKFGLAVIERAADAMDEGKFNLRDLNIGTAIIIGLAILACAAFASVVFSTMVGFLGIYWAS